jgi:hemerythrin-like domain-containing protein
MIVSLGAPTRPEGLVPLLLDCHARIRKFTAMAAAIADGQETSETDLREACAACRRYFVEALPRHVADEEERILTRLRGRDDALDEALGLMHDQHGEHGPMLAELVDILERVEASPADRTAREALARVTATLQRDFEDHLHREETLIFPKIDSLLTPEDHAKIRGELRARRP